MVEGLINANGEKVPMASILQQASDAGRRHPDKWSTFTEWIRTLFGICDSSGRAVDQQAEEVMREIKDAFDSAKYAA